MGAHFLFGEIVRQKLFSVTLKDCEVKTMRAGGKGGQHQNKTESAVRIVHPPSKAVGECREYREQIRNKRMAFKRMVETKEFKNWVRIEGLRESGELRKIEDQVEKEMRYNTKTELVVDGEWVDEKDIKKD
jgi:protein subunit release factor B